MDVFDKEYFDEMKDDIETILENQKKIMEKLDIDDQENEDDDDEEEFENDKESLVDSDNED